MEITKNWLERELLLSDAYRGYKMEWFLAQEEKDTIKLVEKLLRTDIRKDFDNKYDRDGFYSAALEFANWLLIRSMNNKQLLNYVVYTVGQVLPYLKQDCPDETSQHHLMALVKAYIKTIPGMDFKDKLAYRNFLYDLLKYNNTHVDSSLELNILWLTYASHLAAYTALYSTFDCLPSFHPFPVECATHAVTFAISYLPTKTARNRMFKETIEYALCLMTEKTGDYYQQPVFREMACVN
jgi:hypothetical protein